MARNRFGNTSPTSTPSSRRALVTHSLGFHPRGSAYFGPARLAFSSACWCVLLRGPSFGLDLARLRERGKKKRRSPGVIQTAAWLLLTRCPPLPRPVAGEIENSRKIVSRLKCLRGVGVCSPGRMHQQSSEGEVLARNGWGYQRLLSCASARFTIR